MKNSLSVALALLVSLATSISGKAQIVVPDLSPFSTITQKIGFNEVRIEYSRPSTRGRIVFGELVPYGQVWRTGANSSTKLIVREELTIQDQYTLHPGTYALYTIPGKDEWTIIVSKDAGLWGAYGYTEGFDAMRFVVKPERLKEQVETFTIQFANVCMSCAEIQLLWDFTRVSFRVNTNVDDKVMADIKQFTTNPENKVAGEYYLAAKYYLDTNRDLTQALAWIDKSLQYGPEAYWVIHTKAEILAKMGDYNAAIEAATLSKEKATAKDDEDYIRINEQEIAKWKELKKNRFK